MSSPQVPGGMEGVCVQACTKSPPPLFFFAKIPAIWKLPSAPMQISNVGPKEINMQGRAE